MGGLQVWTDHRWWNDWRVQRNAITDRWRLLDPRQFCRFSGGRDECFGALLDLSGNETSRYEGVDELQTNGSEGVDYVLLLHGLMRTQHSMRTIHRAVVTELPEWRPISFSYASTCGGIHEHALGLRELIESLPDVRRIAFVGHSLGNIVVRRLLNDWRVAGQREWLERGAGMVMLGPPNQGSIMAKRLSRLRLFRSITGRAGEELGAGWGRVQSQLDAPEFPFLVVAGQISRQRFPHPLLKGDSDLVVQVEETRLEGATEHVVVPALHSFLMYDPKVVAKSLQFLKSL